MKTMGGEIWWEEIRSCRRYRLQRHVIQRSHCRILDRDNNRVAFGSESDMLAKFEELERREQQGLPPQPTRFNVRAKTLGGEKRWDTLAEQNGLKLQRLHRTKHCRIIDTKDENRRLAHGTEDELREILRGLSAGTITRASLLGVRHVPNRRHKTMGGRYCWETVDAAGIYRLQKNIFAGNCRILDLRNVCVDYGGEQKMRARLKELAAEQRAFRVPAMGDVIGVERGAYDHYGVYVSDDEVIEFSPRNKEGRCIIQRTTFSAFIGGSKHCFYLVFPEQYGTPGKVAFSPKVRVLRGIQLERSQIIRTFLDSIRPNVGAYWDVNVAQALDTPAQYHLYSPQETVERARAHVGKDRFGDGASEPYSLHRNNCEHFAIWCKTGLRMSTQAERGMIRSLRALADLGGGAEEVSPTDQS